LPRDGLTWCSNTPREPVLDSSSPSAPPSTHSFAVGGFERGARLKGRDASARLSSEGQAPVHLYPRPFSRCDPGEELRWGAGLLWTEPPIDFCNETRRTSTSTRLPPRPPPIRDPLRSRRSPGVCATCPPPSEDEDGAPCATRHPCTTRDGFASDRPPRAFAQRRPRCMSGPATLKRRARSLLGFLRACLLRRQPSIPLSPTRCHGGLEVHRRASRGPSRPVSRVERSRVRHHVLAKALVPAPSREGWRFPEDQGAFRRQSPPGLEGRPSPLRVGLSVTTPALGWVRALRSGDQRLCYREPSASP